ncbi:RDD family protein [Kurthia huakuii]|uniref:RDD family protein n=1 Tax=Kurthia huakuii TaxID=1421019 RepID=UPI00049628D8|nr:RDD family protein [Kurthia huakuii]MBM7697776.1 putative RDD family membrane protein YckC [Kurthia huakuii]
MEQTYDTTYEAKAAGFWIRLCAYTVDVLLIWAVLKLLIVHNLFRLTGLDDVTVWVFSLENIVAGLAFYLYFVLMTKLLGQTLGKMIFGLQVVSDYGAPLSWTTVLVREWFGRYISATIQLLYVIVAITPQHKAIHDYLADTHVVQENTFEVVKKQQLPPLPEVKELQGEGQV